jgi:hypothetical protein
MKYKTVKKPVPWCETCKSEITGNGSVVLPYECKCGYYEWDDKEKDYIIKR